MANAVFMKVLDEFSREHRLSKRETEILDILLSGVTSSEAISNTLKISPNTTNNHIKSILDKTKASSKTEVLTRFLKLVLDDDKTVKFKKTPRILVVDDEQDIASILAESFVQMGLEAYYETKPENVIHKISQLHVDFLLIDIRMPEIDGFQLLKQVRSQFHQFPIVFMMTGYSRYTKEECLNEGAAAFFPKPVIPETIYAAIRDYYQGPDSSPSTGKRLLVENVQIPLEYIGYGGLFLPTSPDKLKKLRVGDQISFSFQTAESTAPILTVGEVMWKRQDEADNYPTGCGVRYVNIERATLETLYTAIREKNSTSFIPIGSALGASA